MGMTIEQAHKLLDEEYAKNEVVNIGNRKGKIPNSARVVASLLAVTEIAKSESSYFSLDRADMRGEENEDRG